MKFVIDGMFGKLTRWLRMLGHDVKYDSGLDDKTLIKVAKVEKRILLTRDVELYQRATSSHVEAFLVEGKSEAERLANLSTRFDLSLEFNPLVSRCPKCNTEIRAANKEKIGYKIPPSTKAFYEDFWECPKCGKVYWQGAHWSRIADTLNDAREIQRRK